MATEKVKVLYIAGSSRSGSTILGNVLGQIDGFFHVGELFHIWQRGFVENWRCGCGSLFRECDIWKATTDKVFGGIDKVDAEKILSLLKGFPRTRHIPLLLIPGTSILLKRRLREYLNSIEQLYKDLHHIIGYKVIVDSSKSPAYLWALSILPNIDLYTIHLIRHPQGYAFSYMRKRPYPSGIDTGKYMMNQHPIKSALVWLFENAGIELLCHRQRYMRVYYEDFIMQPRDTLINILNFVEERNRDLSFVNNQTVKLNSCHTISGNPVRFKVGEIKLHLDTEWLYNMPFKYKFLVYLLTWPLLLKYSYHSSRGYKCSSC
mgnify:CR=1 FL=1